MKKKIHKAHCILMKKLFSLPLFETAFFVQLLFGNHPLQIRIEINIILQQSYWILLITDFFQPICIKKNKDDTSKRSVLRQSVASKAIDAINLDNIIYQISVKSKIPPYFKDQIVVISLPQSRS